MTTSACWLTLPEPLLDDLPYTRAENLDGIFGLAYVMHHVGAFRLMSEPFDLHHTVGDRWAAWFTQPTSGRYQVIAGNGDAAPEQVAIESLREFCPTIYIYDNYPGGVGLSDALFAIHPQWFAGCLELIRDCPCAEGCPACVGPPPEVGRRAKHTALGIVQLILRQRDRF